VAALKQMSFLEARSILKKFPGVVALRNVDLTVEAGRVHCIIGENGAGKSTLVKILTGVYTPDEGEVIIDGVQALEHPKVFEKVSYVPQELNLFQELTVSENLFVPFEKSGFRKPFLTKGQLYQAARPYLETFRIHARPDQKVKNVSVSDQQLLQIARASTNRHFQTLILDEPTTSLTSQETERLFAILRRLRAEGKAIILISHKLDELFDMGDTVTVLRNGEKVGAGKVSEVTPGWVVSNMCGQEIDVEEDCRPATAAGDIILSVQALSGPGFSDISFTLRKGEILGFAGLVGAGRSEIMQTLFGFLPKTDGNATFDGRPWVFGDTHFAVKSGLIYLPEERKLHGILPFLSVKHNIGISLFAKTANRLLISNRMETNLVQRIVKLYDIRTASLEKQIMYLSGGNQQKAIIGRAMYSLPKVLIFDEPTKGIDVKAKNDIYHLLKRLAEQQQLGIILVSSELRELLKCANRIVTIYEGRKSGEFETGQTSRQELLRAIIGAEEGKRE
jgi:ABC-type sugar transport system ATPase subunit